MASAAYNAWAASVRAGGGTVVVPALGAGGFNVNTGKYIAPKVLSAGYPASVWVPKVNGKNPVTGLSWWPMPSEYSANGQTAYYPAPLALQTEMTNVHVATPPETAKGADILMAKWKIPPFLQSLSAYGKSIALIGGVLLLVLVAVKSRGQRSWE